MTAAAGNPPSFFELEPQLHALADRGVPMWRKDERVDLQLLLRVPPVLVALADLTRAGELDSDVMWEALETCIQAATALLRPQDFGPAALESFGMTAKSRTQTTVEDRDALAAAHIGPGGHKARWYRDPYPQYGNMWPRHFVASQVAAALLGAAQPDRFVREARARALSEPASHAATERFPDYVRMLDALLLPAVPELVVAIARPIGTDTTDVITKLTGALLAASYLVSQVKLSGLIQAAAEAEHGEPLSSPQATNGLSR